MGWVGGYSISVVYTYVCLSSPQLMYKKIAFVQHLMKRCIIIRYWSNLIAGKIHMVLGELWSICKSCDPLAWGRMEVKFVMAAEFEASVYYGQYFYCFSVF